MALFTIHTPTGTFTAPNPGIAALLTATTTGPVLVVAASQRSAALITTTNGARTVTFSWWEPQLPLDNVDELDDTDQSPAWIARLTAAVTTLNTLNQGPTPTP